MTCQACRNESAHEICPACADSQWFTMESAPTKNREQVLLYIPGNSWPVQVGCYTETCQWHTGYYVQPSHWMPTPSAPKVAK